MERVLVVPTDLVLAELEPKPFGFYPGRESRCLDVVRQHGRFEDRGLAEINPELKQIIPYGMVLWQGQVFLVRRTRKGGEARLHEKTSIGVGGHINPADASSDSPLDAAVATAFARELHEELVVESPYSSEAVGVLNDDSNSVGRVHLGIVYRVVLRDPFVSVRETENLQGSFVPELEVSRYRPTLETWSGLLQEHYWPSR